MKSSQLGKTGDGGLPEATGITQDGPFAKATTAMQHFIKNWVDAQNRESAAQSGADMMSNLASTTSDMNDGINQAAGTPVRHPPGLLDVDSSFETRRPPAGESRFLTATFVNRAGSRPYKLFVPSGYRPETPVPLVVMLHGCSQSPDDFAAGTRMNEFAERQNFLVVYPGQSRSANIQKCWNWYRENQQRRDLGEPSLIAGITREIIAHYAVDRRRVYVAGISAGGAAAAIMGDAYPDLYAAIGVHSGLACGAAYNLSTAMTAMRGGYSAVLRTDASNLAGQHRAVPAIIFHGDRDTTVHPRNAQAVVVQSAGSSELTMNTDDVHVADGHDYSRMTGSDSDGNTIVEQWMIHGGGHAWSGGSPAGSYTDPLGPDATREMLRFFLEHPLPAPAAEN